MKSKYNIQEVKKKNGTTVYKTRLFLGRDTLTGIDRYTTITCNKKSDIKSRATQKINEFIANGSTTIRQSIVFKNFEELAWSWFEGYEQTKSENSVETMRSLFRVYIIPALGKYKLDKITAPLIQSIINQWVRNANTATKGKRAKPKGHAKNVKLLLGTIRRILQHGFELGQVDNNCAVLVRVPDVKDENDDKIKYLNDEEVTKFFAYLKGLDNSYKNIFDMSLYMFLIATGLRISEALALEWQDFDFDNALVRVHGTMTRKGNLQTKTKSKSSMREISLDSTTLDMMLAFKKRSTVEFMNKKKYDIKSVFPSSVGTHSVRTNLMPRLKKHYKASGVTDVGFHGFRHTQSSVLLNAGADYKEIQHRLGHSSIKITLDTYSHLAPDKAKETASVFQEAAKKLGFGF